jgi:GNAT superfamily N-acetyltransferase
MEEVTTVGSGDEARAVATAVLAFSADPMMRWLFPDPDTYIAHFPKFVRAVGGTAFARQTADTCADGGGIALWLGPGVEADASELGGLLALIDERVRSALLELLAKVATYQVREPHWTLPLIAVDPARQGEGIGGRLLEHRLAICDEQRLAAYLESSNPANVPLYQRHGFEIQAEVQLDSSPVVTPMVRLPR